MNKTLNTFLLTYLEQLEFTYSACRLFTKHRERIQNFEKQVI